MDRIVEFATNHLLLTIAAAVVILLLLGNELLRLVKGEKRLSPADAVRLINSEDALVLDVRSAADFKKGHILNARNIALARLADHEKELSKHKDSPIICYCTLGSTAPQACEKLSKMGFSKVYSLRGGLNAWEGASLPVTTK